MNVIYMNTDAAQATMEIATEYYVYNIMFLFAIKRCATPFMRAYLVPTSCQHYCTHLCTLLVRVGWVGQHVRFSFYVCYCNFDDWSMGWYLAIYALCVAQMKNKHFLNKQKSIAATSTTKTPKNPTVGLNSERLASIGATRWCCVGILFGGQTTAPTE